MDIERWIPCSLRWFELLDRVDNIFLELSMFPPREAAIRGVTLGCGKYSSTNTLLCLLSWAVLLSSLPGGVLSLTTPYRYFKEEVGA